MNKSIFSIITLIISFLSFDLIAQDNHYWFIQPDGEAALLGASVTASTRDNTAIYYNPGALGFINDSRLSFNANVYFLNTYFIENGAGDGVNLSSNSLDGLPLLFSGNIQIKKAPNFTLSYLYMGRHKSRRRLEASNSISDDILDEFPGDEVYVASYTSDINMREDWVGLGFGYKVNENLGVGISPIVTIYSNKFLELTDATVFGANSVNNTRTLLASSSIQKDANISAIGLVINVGIAYKTGNNSFGFSVLSPRISLDALSLSSSNRIETEVLTTNLEVFSSKYIARQSSVKTVYKSPWEINLGYSHQWEKVLGSIRVAYYNSIGTYDMLRTDTKQGAIYSGELPRNPGPAVPQMTNNQVLNLGIGYERKLANKLTLLAGFHTDFAFITENDVNLIDFVPAQSFWDIYHLSSGVFWDNKKIKLNLGLSYAFGRKKNFRQLVNITSPTLESGLLGERTKTAKVIYNQYRVYFGVALNINAEKKEKN